MTKNEALYNFFASCGITAYPSTAVPDDAQFPYITFMPVTASMGDGDVSIQTDLWYSTESESVPNTAAQAICDKIGRGGLMLVCDTGAIWLKMGSISFRNLNDPEESIIKRRSIDIEAEFLTSN